MQSNETKIAVAMATAIINATVDELHQTPAAQDMGDFCREELWTIQAACESILEHVAQGGD